MIIGFGGKGGVGKTTVLALLLDEVARRDYSGQVLVIDGDPAMTLAMALGLETDPVTTLAGIRDSTPLTAGQIRGLPPGMSREQYVSNLLESQGCIVRGKLREMAFHFMAMGHSEKPGCYCRINRALTGALNAIRQKYDLILIDNEAGLEHISRYRLTHIDLFALIMTQGRSSWAVANRLRFLIDDVGLQVGQIWQIYNRLVKTGRSFSSGADEHTLFLPESDTIGAIDRQGGSPVYLVENHPLRLALEPLVTRICGPTAGHTTGVPGVISPDTDAFALLDVAETDTEIEWLT